MIKARRSGTLAAALAFLLAASAAIAATVQYGDKIDPKAQKVALKDLLKTPATYKGKDVVINGTFSGKCCDADFNFKDGVDTIEVRPPATGNGKQCMALKPGTAITLFGRVNVIQREAPAGEKAPEPIVTVDAKGIATR